MIFTETFSTFDTASEVVGSYVVYDPTGRDLPDCMEVGRVVRVVWTRDDDGDSKGRPRPILYVLPNGAEGDDPSHYVGVTVVQEVIWR